MFIEPLRANDVQIVSFQASDEGELDKKVNEWLQEQSSDVVVYHMMFGHALAVNESIPGWSFSAVVVYGSKPLDQ